MFKMAKTIFKNLFSKPATRKYPFEKREPFKNARGHIAIDIDKCILCGICSKQCPAGAIEVNKEGKYWEIDRFKCISCAYCVEKCAKKALNMNEEYVSPAQVKTKYREDKNE